MSLRSVLCAARRISAAFTARSTTKAKSRSSGWKGESSRTGRARVALAFGFAVRRGPMASDAGRFGESAANAASGGELILRAIAAENLSDLEQRYVGEPAIPIVLCRGNKARDQARSHIGKIRGNWIGERQFGVPAAEQLGLPPPNKRPSYGLEHAARGERALGLSGAQLNGREHRLARSLTPIKRRRRNTVDAEDTHDLLHQVSLALDIPPP